MEQGSGPQHFQNGSANRQLPLFARKAQLVFPKVKQSADALGEVEADDAFRYTIKGDAPGKLVRASEWVCSHLAEEVGIACPHPMVIEMPTASTVYGSRRITGVADDATTARFLLTPSNTNVGEQIRGLGRLLSSIYAFDMFVFNDDRHFGNYLSIDDNGVRRLYTFDFSRSLFWHWPIAAFPSPGCNTRVCGTVLWQNHGFDLAAAMGVLDRLNALDARTLDGFVNRMPEDWLPESARHELGAWWLGRSVRIDELRKGLGDGSLV